MTAPGPRRVGEPHAAEVHADAAGRPVTVGSETVDAVRETWLVEDRWWTDRPLRRRYWEVVTAGGRNIVVFHELIERRWYRQR
jgi:hypothetical protein